MQFNVNIGQGKLTISCKQFVNGKCADWESKQRMLAIQLQQ